MLTAYARFEHLGDTVLGLVVTTQIQQMYPGLRVGPSTVRPLLAVSASSLIFLSSQKIRALVVGNQNLAAMCVSVPSSSDL